LKFSNVAEYCEGHLFYLAYSVDLLSVTENQMQRFIPGICHAAMKYIFLLAACTLFSCKKDLSCESCIPGKYNSNAKIIWTGPVEADGCSWAVVINDTYYHASALSQTFQKDQLNVVVEYQLTNDHFVCGLAGIGFPIIHINKIRLP